jgi:hypothetical protein
MLRVLKLASVSVRGAVEGVTRILIFVQSAGVRITHFGMHPIVSRSVISPEFCG